MANLINPLHQSDPRAQPRFASSIALDIAGPELCIVIPTFNERDNIAPLVEKLRDCLAGISYEVIFVDDDSKDKTLDSVNAIARRDRRIRGMRRLNRRGDAEMVVATRFENPGNSVDGLTRVRHVGSRLAIRIAQRFLKVGISDPMSGFFMVKRDIVQAVAPRLSQQGFKILMDIVASTPEVIKITELPYVFKPRLHGESKLDSSVVFEYLGLVVSKASGDLISSRMLSFCLVGSLGVLIHLAVLRILLLNGVTFAIGQTIAMLVALASNYTFNNAITYKDRRRRGWRFATGLVLFAALCSVGVVAGVGVSTLFYTEQPRWWLDGLAGAAIGVVWNYITSSAVTWRAR